MHLLLGSVGCGVRKPNGTDLDVPVLMSKDRLK